MDASPPLATLVLVDADSARRESVGENLKSSGCRVVSATEFPPPETALTGVVPAAVLAASFSPMPRMLEACRRFKMRRADLPLIVYAPKANEALRLRFMEAGADEYVCSREVAAALNSIVGVATAAPSQACETGESMGAQWVMQLERGELANVIQFLAMSSRSGRARLNFPNGSQSGDIFVQRGRVVHAEFGDAAGLEAVARLLGQAQAQLCFDPDAVMETETIRCDADALLIQATVLADELAAGSGGMA